MSIINGTSGPDRLIGTGADDTFNGFDGQDTAVIASNSGAVTYRIDGDGNWVVASSQGVDTLRSVEAVEFDNGAVTLTARSPDFQISSSEGGAGHAVAPLAGGGFIAASIAAAQIFLQRFSSAGSKDGPVSMVQLGAAASAVAVAQLPNGSVVLAWSQDAPEGSAIYAQQFGTLGHALTDAAQLSSAGDEILDSPVIEPLKDGSYVVAWHSMPRTTWGLGDIHAQRFDAAGHGITADAVVSPAGEWLQPTLAALPDGGLMVGMSSQNSVQLQRFDATNALVSASTAYTYTGYFEYGDTEQQAVAALGGGGWVAAWLQPQASNYAHRDIAVQRYDAQGAKVGAATIVSTEGVMDNMSPVITGLDDGGYAVAWVGYGTETGADVYAQRFDASGGKLGGAALVNSATAGTQDAPAIAPLDDGYLVTWSSYDASGQSEFLGQRVGAAGAPATAPILTGGSDSDVLLVTAAAQGVEILGMAGDDTLSGGAGNDTLVGGPGIDMATYAAARATFALHGTTDGFTVSSAASGSDALIGVERLHFADGNLALDVAGAGHAGTVARIVGAVIGTRALHDPAFMGTALRLADASAAPDGTLPEQALVQTALQFALGASPSNETVARTLYTNVTGQTPAAATLAYYTSLLDTGAMSPAALGVFAAETPENAAHIDLVGLAYAGLPYV